MGYQSAYFAKCKKKVKSNRQNIDMIEQACVQYYFLLPNQTFKKNSINEVRTLFVISSLKK